MNEKLKSLRLDDPYMAIWTALWPFAGLIVVFFGPSYQIEWYFTCPVVRLWFFVGLLCHIIGFCLCRRIRNIGVRLLIRVASGSILFSAYTWGAVYGGCPSLFWPMGSGPSILGFEMVCEFRFFNGSDSAA